MAIDTSTLPADPKVIVALDFSSPDSALRLVDQLAPGSCRLKVGKELFTQAGPALVSQLVDRGFDVFLDLKYHDIPNTVAKACAMAADLGVWMVNVHASGGRRMMNAAREALDAAAHRPLLIAVTVLTSMGEEDLKEIGMQGTPREGVIRLATLARDSGMDGVVCSPLEVQDLRQRLDSGFKLVTPGVRPAGTDVGDQKRIMTPADAIIAGSDYLVIGRPITQAQDPVAALAAINGEI